MRPPEIRGAFVPWICGFSLVETMIALGILAFALVAIIGLLPVGLKLDQTSLSETVASQLATLIEADLRESDPSTNVSRRFGIGPLPYRLDSSTAVPVERIASAVPPAMGQTNIVRFFTEAGVPVANSSQARLRATLRHESGPGLGSTPTNALVPLTASLTISWPPELDPFGTGARPAGVFTTLLSFPAP